MTDKKRKWRWRRLLQFNLRIFLVGCAAVAIGVWWFVQPPWEQSERELPGDVRILESRREVLRMQATGERDEQSFGKVTVRNARDRYLIVGRFRQGQAHGPWTFYHENGRRRLKGTYFQDRRVGEWKEWHENGRLAWEADYGARGESPTDDVVAAADRRVEACAWWESGSPQFQGQYRQNLAVGHWRFWDRQGRLTAEGEMSGGLKQGTWQEAAAEEQKPADAFYAAGHRAPSRSELRSRAAAGLANNDWATQREAIDLLAYLGQEGAREIVAAMDNVRPDLRRFALVRLRDMGEEAASVSDSMARWAEHEDDQLRLEALLTWFAIAEQQRPALCNRLLDHAAEVSGRARFRRLRAMRPLTAELLPHVVAVLDGPEEQRRHLAEQWLQAHQITRPQRHP